MSKLGIAVYKVAMTAALGASAIAGNRASPSFDIALAIRAEKGMKPCMYKVVTMICGPHPGNNPTRQAINGMNKA